jgi:hypothetical protein
VKVTLTESEGELIPDDDLLEQLFETDRTVARTEIRKAVLSMRMRKTPVYVYVKIMYLNSVTQQKNSMAKNMECIRRNYTVNNSTALIRRGHQRKPAGKQKKMYLHLKKVKDKKTILHYMHIQGG